MCEEAVAIRDVLLDRIEAMQLPHAAIDSLIDQLGAFFECVSSCVCFFRVCFLSVSVFQCVFLSVCVFCVFECCF